MKYSAPPYMHDVLPFEPARDAWLHAARWHAVEALFRETCRVYGYHEIRTPVMEATELFTRSIGQGTDIVSKEMFSFEDRGGRNMTLRPEGTAPAIRAYLEHNIGGERAVAKLYYIASIYRYERGQRGRYREHQQTGVEVLGARGPDLDAEVLSLAVEFYRRLGIVNTELLLNSVGCPDCRPSYRAALVAYAEPLADRMSDDNRRRLEINPLRMLDSKDPRDIAALAEAPVLTGHLCSPCREHFDGLLEILGDLGIAYRLAPRLVRGFDYYTRTAFEVVSPELGAQNVIGGGGRYDGLVEECGGPPTPGIGFGIGTERCLLVLEQLGKAVQLEDDRPALFVVTIGAAARRAAARLVYTLRAAGIAADLDYAGRSVKAQMRQADRSGARYSLVLGDTEAETGQAALRDMSGGGEPRTVAIGDLASILAAPTAHTPQGG